MSCPFANSKYGGCGCHDQKYGGGRKKKRGTIGAKTVTSSSISSRSASVAAIAAIQARRNRRRKQRRTKRYEGEDKKGLDSPPSASSSTTTTTKKPRLSRHHKIQQRQQQQQQPNTNPVRFNRLIDASEETKKYCSCVAKTAAKQSRECLKHISKGGNPRDMPGCYNPYALCGRIKPKSMGTGCAVLYDYESMPKNLVSSLAMLKGKTMKEMISKAHSEIESLKKKSTATSDSAVLTHHPPPHKKRRH